MNETESRWPAYYKATADRPPRELLRQALYHVEPAAGAETAIDLGCGAGKETSELLQRGWRVVAFDKEAEAIRDLPSRTPAEHQERLEAHQSSFEELELPSAHLVWAGLSLPFCPPGHFDALWEKIVHALQPGGIFAGDFFGPRHVWADNPALTILSSEQVKQRFNALTIEYFVEEEGRRRTALQGMQHWHGFSVIARKA